MILIARLFTLEMKILSVLEFTDFNVISSHQRWSKKLFLKISQYDDNDELFLPNGWSAKGV